MSPTGWPGREAELRTDTAPHLLPSLAVILGAGALLLAGCTIERGDVRTPSGQPPEADSTTIRLALERLVDSYAASDAEGLRRLVTGDITFVIDGVRGRGASAFVGHLLAPEPIGTGDLGLRIAALDIELVDGELAWVTSRFPSGDVPAGQATVETAATLIFERIDSDWKLVHAHFTRASDGGLGNP